MRAIWRRLQLRRWGPVVDLSMAVCHSILQGAFRTSNCSSGLVMRAFHGMRSYNRDGERASASGFACVCMPSLAARLGLGLENSSTPRKCNGRRRTSPTHSALSPHALPSSHVFAIQFPCFLLNACDTRQHVGSQVTAAAPPRLTRRRTSATPSFPGRNSDDNQAHCGSRVLPWPWMREICRRT